LLNFSTTGSISKSSSITLVLLTRLPSIAMLVNVSHARQNSRKSSRPPRIRVPNNEQAVFTVDGRKMLGVVKRLSLTGGSVVLSRGTISRGTLADMYLNTIYGRITAQIEFLQTGADGLPSAQAFRFLSMDQVSRQRFTAAAEQMQRAGFSDSEPPRSSLDSAYRGFSKLCDTILGRSAASNRANGRNCKNGKRS